MTCGAAYDVTFADPDKGTVVVGGAVVGIGVTGAVGVGCGVVGVTHRMETPPSLPYLTLVSTPLGRKRLPSCFDRYLSVGVCDTGIPLK